MKKYFIIPIVILSLFFTWGCNNQNKSNNKNDKEIIKIGAILPLTGDLSEYGVDEQKGILLAMEKINKNHNILNVIFEDNNSLSKNSVSIYQKMKLKNINLFFSLGSNITNSLIPLIKKDKNVLISVAADPSIASKSNYLFRNFPSADLQSLKLSKYLIGKEIDKIDIIYINDDFGTSSMNSFKNNFKKLGGKIENIYSFEKNKNDYKTVIYKVIAKNPSSIFLAGYGDALGYIIKQLRELNYKGKIFSSVEVSYPNVLNIAGKSAEGILFAALPFPNDTSNLTANEFTNNFRSKYNKNPTLDAALAYDQTMLIAYIYSNYKINSNEEFITNLQKVKGYHGVIGNFSVDADGNFSYKLVLKIIKNNKVVIFE